MGWMLLACLTGAQGAPSHAQEAAAIRPPSGEVESSLDPAPGEGEGGESATETERSGEPESVFRDTGGAPPGFETLIEPQRTLVDLSFAGDSLSPVEAIYAPGSFVFVDPVAVVALLSGIKNEAEVVAALRGKLAPNANKVCRSRGVPAGCGRIEVETAGVIFDEGRFAVEVVLHPRMIEIAPIELERYLPPPKDEFSTLASLSGSYSGLSESSDAYDLQGDAIAAFGRQHLRVVGGVGTGGRGRLERLVGEINWPDYEMTGGIFRSLPIRAMGDREFAGLRASVSHKTQIRQSLEKSYSSPIQVFLPRRSRIEVLRDGRLLASGIYDAGSQNLDTSALPEGAYDVELRIIDSVSGDREEQRFFAKSTQLPPRGEPLYFGEAGILRRDRTQFGEFDFDGAFMRVGGAIRHTDRLGYDADIAWVNREVIFGLGTFVMDRGVNLRAGGIVSHRGAGGIELLGSVNRWGSWATLNVRGLWGDTDPEGLGAPYTDINGRLGKAIGPFNYQLRAQWRQSRLSGGVQSNYAVTPSVRWSFLRGSRFRGDAILEFSQTDQGQVVWLRFNVLMWYRDWTLQENADLRYTALGSENHTSFDADLRAIWHDRDLWPGDARFSPSVHSRAGRRSIGFETDYRGTQGGASLYAEQAWPRGSPNETLYGGSFGVGLAGRSDGISLGGRDAARSAVVVDLRGTPAGAVFDVLTGSTKRGTALVGKRTLIFFEPYHAYDVRIVPRGDLITAFDTEARKVSLFPGTTSLLVWNIDQVFILLTVLVRENGEFAADMWVDGAVGPARTDAYGFLQAEVSAGSTLTLRDPKTREEVCSFQVPAPLPGSDMIEAHELVCH
jgi:hypothetical protein